MKCILLFCSFTTAFNLYALVAKMATLVPQGTNWAIQLKAMAQEIEQSTSKRVTLKFYFGGLQGDENDALRKIRIGQLHGGIFTGKVLGDINPDIRVLELPFTFFGDRQKAFKVMNSLSPHFQKKLAEKGFVNLGLVEIGSVYFVSKTKVENLKGLTGLKIWSWQDDKLVTTMLEEMKLISVPLNLPDVLPSLSTGIVDAVYAPPLGIVGLQWHTKVNYLVDLPLAYSIGGLLIDKKIWSKIAPKDRENILQIGKKFVPLITEANAQDNIEALNSMKSMGIQFMNIPKSDIEEGKRLRQKVVDKLQNTYFSENIYNKLSREL